VGSLCVLWASLRVLPSILQMVERMFQEKKIKPVP